MFIGYGPAHVMSYISMAIHEKQLKDNLRKFPPNTKVKFTGTVQQLAIFIDSEHPDLDSAKAVMFDGATGIILSSDEFNDVKGVYYTVDFGSTGYHIHLIPEEYLENYNQKG